MGEKKVESFARLYMIPGMEHCSGGPGASAFGQFGTETAKEPKHGLFDSLQMWVENGSPSEDVVATKYATGEDGAKKVAMTRPLCAYPKVAKYKGTGEMNDTESYACVAP
jgi:feruloyl esterase